MHPSQNNDNLLLIIPNIDVPPPKRCSANITISLYDNAYKVEEKNYPSTISVFICKCIANQIEQVKSMSSDQLWYKWSSHKLFESPKTVPYHDDQ